MDEYASRVERALSASTLEALDELRADLPMLRVPEPAGGGIWARGSAAPGSRLPATSRSASSRRDHEPTIQAQTRVVAMLVAAITIAVVIGAIVLGLVAEWAWAAVLIVGWGVGVMQGRLARRPDRRS